MRFSCGTQCETRRGVVATVAAAACLAVVGAGAQRAAASVPEVQRNITNVADHVARGGAVEVAGTSCGTQCSTMWAHEHHAVAGSQSRSELQRQLRSVRVAGRVLPALRTVHGVALAYHTFELGWKIGTGIRTKFLRIGVPERTSSSAYGGAQAINWEPGSYVAINNPPDWPTWSDLGHPQGVWRWTFDNGRTQALVSGRCTQYMPDPPGGFQRTPSYVTYTWCTSDGTSAVAAYFQEEDRLPAPAPIEDYAGQPADVSTPSWGDQQTDRTRLEQDVSAALARNRLAEAWYCHQSDPMLCAVPPQLESSRDQCELTPPRGEDPAPERGSGDSDGEFFRRYEKVPQTAFPQGAAWPHDGIAAQDAPLGVPVFMRWGYTRRVENVYADWGGWGFRHIAAKHGWGAADKAATVEALQRAPVEIVEVEDTTRSPTDPRYVERYRYHGPVYQGRYGASCVREVIVDFDYNAQGGDNRRARERASDVPAPSIITSYGREL